MLVLSDPTAGERSYAIGAEGEEQVAGRLARYCPGIPIMHDRRIPRTRANIDHLAVTASGVWVIDTKRYRGRIEVRRPLFGEPRLVIGGRDQTTLVERLAWQVESVGQALAAIAPSVDVHGCLCFVAPRGTLPDGGLPLLRTLSIDGFPLLSPRRLAARLRRGGDVTAGGRDALAAALAQRFPPA